MVMFRLVYYILTCHCAKMRQVQHVGEVHTALLLCELVPVGNGWMENSRGFILPPVWDPRSLMTGATSRANGRHTADLRGFQPFNLFELDVCSDDGTWHHGISWHCLDRPHWPVAQASRKAWKALPKLTLHSPIRKNQVLCAEFRRVDHRNTIN